MRLSMRAPGVSGYTMPYERSMPCVSRPNGANASGSRSEAERDDLRAVGDRWIARRKCPIVRERAHARLDLAGADALPAALRDHRLLHRPVRTKRELDRDL